MNDRHDEQLAARLALAIGRISRRMRSATVGGISYGQLSALSTIVRFGPLRLGDLTRMEEVAAPTVTRLVAALETAGYVTRVSDAADGRAWVISATEQGIEALMEARRHRSEVMAELLGPLDDDDHTRILEAVEALEALAGVADPPPERTGAHA